MRALVEWLRHQAPRRRAISSLRRALAATENLKLCGDAPVRPLAAGPKDLADLPLPERAEGQIVELTVRHASAAVLGDADLFRIETLTATGLRYAPPGPVRDRLKVVDQNPDGLRRVRSARELVFQLQRLYEDGPYGSVTVVVCWFFHWRKIALLFGGAMTIGAALARIFSAFG